MHYTGSIDLRKNNQNHQLADNRPIRILHVVGQMHRGGIETWLMHILRHIDRDRFQMDFLVHTTQPCAYDTEIRALGSNIIPCPPSSRLWMYASNFKQILRENGPYNIVHSHVHHFNGYVLRLARQAGVPTRVAHSHTDTSAIDARAGLYRRLYLTLMKWLIARYATVGLGGGRKAAAALFGPAWETDRRWTILYYGIDLTPFQEPTDPIAVRADLSIPTNAFVMAHVGRFVKVKNHAFLLKIVAEVAQREPKVCLLLIGNGELRQEIEQNVSQMGLADHVIFAGLRSDVPQLMLNAIDVFILPSSHEGLPLVGIEAQAAGLPFVLSDVITQEVDIVKPLVQRMSLSQPASAWAETILALKDDKETINQAEAFRLVEQSPFNIQTCVQDLANLYVEKSQHLFQPTL